MKTYIRTVKPGYEGHYGLYALEQRTALPIRNAFRALWGVTDRAGRFDWQPDVLKRFTIPLDHADMRDVLAALEGELYVVRYVVRGRAYGWIPTLGRHQSFNAREAGSVRPAPPRSVISWYEAATFAQNMGQPFDVPNPLSDPGDAPAGWRSVLTQGMPTRSDSLRGAVPVSDSNGNGLHGGSRDLDPSSTRELVPVDASARVADEHSIPFPSALRQFDEQGLETLSSETAAHGSGTQQHALPAIRGGKRTIDAIQRRLATVLTELTDGRRPPLAPEQWRRLAAEMLFAYWAKSFNKPNSFLVPNDERESKINARLDENSDDLGELAYAIDGVRSSPYHRGQNATGATYNALELIFRNRAHVEKYADMSPAYRRGDPHPLVVEHAALLAGLGAPEHVLKQLARIASTNGNGNGSNGDHDADHTDTGHDEP